MRRTILLAGLALVLIPAPVVYGQNELSYTDRGSRYEGIKANPVGGGDIELISVLVDHRESIPVLPPELKVRFYLDTKTEVQFRVRELDIPGHFYWMDKVKPNRPWAPGYQNEFKWDTATVLAKLLPPISPDGLGVLVLARPGQPEPSAEERVAPAILYHAVLPTNISGYLFTVKPCCKAEVTCAIYSETGGRVLATEVFSNARGNRPMTFRWDATGAADGAYKLVVTARSLANNETSVQVVHFSHRRKVE